MWFIDAPWVLCQVIFGLNAGHVEVSAVVDEVMREAVRSCSAAAADYLVVACAAFAFEAFGVAEVFENF